MPMFALTIATMGVMGMLAITFGQAVVRREQAQMVVDAAAFAGAAEQAKGLNTIARINEKEKNIFDAIVTTQLIGIVRGYQDNWDTTLDRLSPFSIGPDWGMENWQAYGDDVFGTLNKSVTAVNVAYGPMFKPRSAARKVIDDNFGTNDDSIFRGETPVDHGVVIGADDALYYSETLVHLTEPADYAIGGGRRYNPNGGAKAEFCSPCALLLVGAPACFEACEDYEDAKYIAINLYFNGKTALFDDAPRYPLGNFYANDEEHEVHFSYFLRVKGASPIYGKEFFKESPDIVVVATAKPYGGYLGAPFKPNYPEFWTPLARFGYSQQVDRKIRYAYKAKLRPVTLGQKLSAAVLNERFNALEPEVLMRYIAIRH